MSKAQFWLLNCAGGAVAVLLLGSVLFVCLNERASRECNISWTPETETASLPGTNPAASFTDTTPAH